MTHAYDNLRAAVAFCRDNVTADATGRMSIEHSVFP